MSNQPKQQLEPQEVASVAALALHFGLLHATDVVAWADSIIADADNPPYWAIELALAKPDSIQELLRQIPGERDENLARRTFIALVRHHWGIGRLAICDVHVIGRKLYFMDPDSMIWGIDFDYEFEAYEEGHMAEDDLRTAITGHLAPFANFEPLLTAWLVRPGTTQGDKKVKVRLYRDAFDAVHDILTHEWDPIGVGNEPMAQDEYNAYISGALRMVADGRADREIANYLQRIETEDMGLTLGDGVVERNMRVARRLREAVGPFLEKPR